VEPIYKMFAKMPETALASDAKQFGVEIGIVTNVKDPEKQGRIKVCFPRLPDKPEGDWCRVAQPAAGKGRGFYWLPQVSDEVLVAFVRGEAHMPIVIGSLWNGQDKPMQPAYTDDNTKIMLQTTSGHQVIFDDKGGQEKIVIADKSGKRTMTFDAQNKKFTIEDAEGDIVIKAKHTIRIECDDLQIKTNKTGKIDIGSTFDLNAQDKANFKAGSQLNIKAARVNIN
jgi:uncharacterized protein involved in type VI secretion and phage assembly